MARRVSFLVALLVAACARLGAVEHVTLFRVFLNDGTAVVSYGEYARVGDRVVFSMPIGAVDADPAALPNLHVVNIPSAAVNWTATDRYTDAARYAHYIETGAESDYAALTGEVAAVLNSVMLANDPQARLNLAMDARRRLAAWPRDHYGYREGDVRQVIGLLDEVISQLRAAAGEAEFSFELFAAPEPPKPMPVMLDPTPAQLIAQALAVAKVTDVSADRVSLLRAVVAAIDDPKNAAPPGWAKPTRQWAIWKIGQEAYTDKVYARLNSTLLRRAAAAAADADVRGVEKILETAQERDVALGRHRPDVMNALLLEVRAKLDAARRLRLARDQWKERAGSLLAYQKAVAPVMATLAGAERDLDDIKRLAGSDAVTLVALGDRIGDGVRTLGVVAVPDELKTAHALLLSALNLADSAIKTRRQAVMAGDIKSAWDASSAAAGSMMLFGKAREDMDATIRLPQLR